MLDSLPIYHSRTITFRVFDLDSTGTIFISLEDLRNIRLMITGDTVVILINIIKTVNCFAFNWFNRSAFLGRVRDGDEAAHPAALFAGKNEELAGRDPGRGGAQPGHCGGCGAVDEQRL